jgi:hypothetical protein
VTRIAEHPLADPESSKRSVRTYQPLLTIGPAAGTDQKVFGTGPEAALPQAQATYPGVGPVRIDDGWEVTVPVHCDVGHGEPIATR